MSEKIADIVVMGTPKLREPAALVSQAEFGSEALQRDFESLKSAMEHYGGIGIAAPQIGLNRQMTLMHVHPDHPRYKDGLTLPLTVLINPTWEALDSTQEKAFEGCLSLPGLRGPVARYVKIRVKAQDLTGKIHTYEAHGAFARIVQHEVDHLNGVLFIDRIAAEDMHRFGFEEALAKAGEDFSIRGSVEAQWRKIEDH